MRAICMGLIGLMLLVVAPIAARADYDAALAAYKAAEYDTAFETWKELAMDGDPRSQYWLGLMLANGTGVKQDVVTAFAWMTLAKGGGIKQADEYQQVLQDNYLPRYCVYDAIAMVRAFENGSKSKIAQGTRQDSRCWRFTTHGGERYAQ